MLLVTLFFGDKDWLKWTPEQQILGQLRQTIQPLSEDIQCKLKCYGIESAAIDSTLVHGDVKLSESETQEMPRMYVVKNAPEWPSFRATFSSDSLEAHLVDVQVIPTKHCDCP